MSFQDSLKRLRTLRHWTQEELGAKVGLDQATLCMYETGKRKPQIETVIKLASVLDVTTDELLGIQSAGLDRDTLELLSKHEFLDALKRLETTDPEALMALAYLIQAKR